VLSADNMKASVSRRESLNGAAEPGRDLLERAEEVSLTEAVRKSIEHVGALQHAGERRIPRAQPSQIRREMML
jgi:hypothetical protein